MLDLVSLKDAVAMQAAAVPKRKSAGLAWLLSLVVPGAGYFYTGRYLRGGLVFGFSLIGLIALASAVASVAQRSSSIIGSLIVELPILWVFGFLDAYMTTVESNRGIDPTVVDNPRVAAVLNLTTNGLGYFYLGERVKGIVLFVALGITPYVAQAFSRPVAAAVSLVLLPVSIGIAVDAYRIGRRAFESQVASMGLPPPPPPSRLPPLVPIILAAAVAFVIVALVLVGAAMLLFGPRQSYP